MRGGSDTNDPPWEDRSADTDACPIESACRHLSTYPLGEAAERQRREQDVRTGQGQGEASKAKDAKQAQPETCAGPKARGSAPPHQHPTQHNVPRRAQSHAGHPSRGTPNERHTPLLVLPTAPAPHHTGAHRSTGHLPRGTGTSESADRTTAGDAKHEEPASGPPSATHPLGTPEIVKLVLELEHAHAPLPVRVGGRRRRIGRGASARRRQRRTRR